MALEALGFPQVFIGVGEYLDGELPVSLSIPEFTSALNEAAGTATTTGSPVPQHAEDIWDRAVMGCTKCHLNGPSTKSVGNGVGVSCGGFQSLPRQADAYTAMVSNVHGVNMAEMVIYAPVDRVDAKFPVLKAPCGVTPTLIFETYVPVSHSS